MDEKIMLKAMLDLMDTCGSIHSEIEDVINKVEELEMVIGRLFDKLCPFKDDSEDVDGWSSFRNKVINYCEGAK